MKNDDPSTFTSAADVVCELTRLGTTRQIAELDRYGIVAQDPFGVAVRELRALSKSIGRHHELSLELWDTSRYEARMLAAMVGEPDRVTLSQMDSWSAEFDSWAIVDNVCIHLFDRTKHAWKKAEQWSTAQLEYRKRAGFALLWAMSVHDKAAGDAPFLNCLEWIEIGADDDRTYVKKAVNMALRAIGKRNKALNAAAIRTAKRLAAREAKAPSWIGGHALRELESDAVRKRL